MPASCAIDGVGQRKHDPLRFLDPLVLHRPHFFRDQLHLVDRNVGQLGDVVAAAESRCKRPFFFIRASS